VPLTNNNTALKHKRLQVITAIHPKIKINLNEIELIFTPCMILFPQSSAGVVSRVNNKAYLVAMSH